MTYVCTSASTVAIVTRCHGRKLHRTGGPSAILHFRTKTRHATANTRARALRARFLRTCLHRTCALSTRGPYLCVTRLQLVVQSHPGRPAAGCKHACWKGSETRRQRELLYFLAGVKVMLPPSSLTCPRRLQRQDAARMRECVSQTARDIAHVTLRTWHRGKRGLRNKGLRREGWKGGLLKGVCEP